MLKANKMESHWGKVVSVHDGQQHTCLWSQATDFGSLDFTIDANKLCV